MATVGGTVYFELRPILLQADNGGQWTQNPNGAWILHPPYLSKLLIHAEVRYQSTGIVYLNSGVTLTKYNVGSLPGGFSMSALFQGNGFGPYTLRFPLGAIDYAGMGIPYLMPVTPSSSGAPVVVDAWSTGVPLVNSVDLGVFTPPNAINAIVSLDLTVQYTCTPLGPGGWGPGGIIIVNTGKDLQAYSPHGPLFPHNDEGLYYFSGSFSYDEDLCTGLSPVTGATVTNPTTGAVSWSVPFGLDGTIVEEENDLGELHYTYLDNAITTYTALGTGNLIIRLYAANTLPICKAAPVTLNVTVTAPFDYTMGTDGPGTGVDVGGAAFIQVIGDPSGIYTLTPGLRHDVLIERSPSVTTQIVKIPNPKLRSGFVGD